MSETASTSRQVSPDSGEIWSMAGPWKVADGVYRLPLPLPNDSLRAVNVYLLEHTGGLTLIDGGWAVAAARDTLESGVTSLGYELRDIRRLLVTHVHRDHYTLARLIGRECGAEVVLGGPERPGLEVARAGTEVRKDLMAADLLQAGAAGLADAWRALHSAPGDEDAWGDPDRWLQGDQLIPLGLGHLHALHTPGHTTGHYVYADRPAGVLFAGDHVLPTITPSVGFESPRARDPLGDFIRSLAKIRALPDMRLLPAHGPVRPSAHQRIDELLAHHEQRLAQCRDVLSAGPVSAYHVAAELTWTRRELPFTAMDVFNQALAALETMAHLDVLVARGQARVRNGGTPSTYTTPASPGR
jgi:glyoxylase-like metal-dependent hydrolase (beta-lactamase superfamily II)